LACAMCGYQIGMLTLNLMISYTRPLPLLSVVRLSGVLFSQDGRDGNHSEVKMYNLIGETVASGVATFARSKVRGKL
jgi:acyl-coenzyme A thioesterase PaaI-like protein